VLAELLLALLLADLLQRPERSTAVAVSRTALALLLLVEELLMARLADLLLALLL
jgi:hypothetical protein